MFRPKLAVWLLIALLAAWLASCSSNVDGYRLATDEAGLGAAGTGGEGPRGTGGPGTTGGGGQTIAPGSGGGGAGGDSDGSAGTGGVHQPPREGGVDADSSLVSGGGAPAGGAGGVQSGGAGGGTGGSNQNGGAGGTGGTPNTGGAVTGGAPNTGGAPVTGGAPTGGRANTGGATGGAPTGGMPNTGGAPTGGMPNTGGSPTGGTAGTGGTGGYPGDPTQVTLTGLNAINVTGITAASWVPGVGFYLLKPSTREYFVLSTDGSVTGPTALQVGAVTIANFVFGANATDVFVVAGNPAKLFRQPIAGGTPTQFTHGSTSLGALTGAYAGGWFLIGNASGAYQALQDGSSTLTTSTNMNQIRIVTTDAATFALRTLSATNTVVVHHVSPGSFTLNQTPCDTTAAGAATLDAALGVYGTNVAWVYKRPFDSLFELHVATIGTDGKCVSPLQTNFGDNLTGSQVVGLIDLTDALVQPTRAGSNAAIEIRRAGDSAFSRGPITVNMGTGSPRMFVVGAEATTHYAVLVTNDVPALVTF